jgi:hypothetical protein
VSAPKDEATPDVSGDHVDAGVKAAAGSHGADEVRIDSPKLAPEQGDAKVDAPKLEAKEAPKAHAPGKIMIMSPQREHSWEDFVNSEPKPEAHAEAPAKRRISAIAAVIALAAVTGAVGGSLATAGIGQMFGPDTTKTASSALEEHVARLDADIAALKGEVDRNAKQSIAARAKTADRLDKLEKAQAEPAAKLAKLSETVEKLRTTPPVPAAAPAPAPAPVASVPAKEVTGSINAPVPTPAPKPEVARLPLVEGWRLLDVAQGGATIEGRQGIFEVYAGDPVPGLGRVDAIRKQDGRWTVITSRGLIVAR